MLLIVGSLLGCVPTPDTATVPGPAATVPGGTPPAAPTGGPTADTAHAGAALPPNVLLVVLDDVGTDKVAAYGESPTAPPTPTISALAAEGVLFRNAWAAPICGPARGMLLTGRLQRRYGFGENIGLTSDFRLPAHERMIPGHLAEAPVPYTSVGAGKWHLSGGFQAPDYMEDPLDRGFSRYVGPPGNVLSYSEWTSATDGELGTRQGYLTTATADDALQAVTTLAEPWFVYLALNAPHAPLHVPPDRLAPGGVSSDTDVAKFDAMLTAADLELGRLLDGMDPGVRERTVVIVLGDNGTPEFAITEPFLPHHGKTTLFEGGINVPLVVAGPVVEAPGTESAALISIVDVAPTVVDIAGIDPGGLPLDGTSFLAQLRDPEAPGPRFAYTEILRANGPPPWDGAWTAVRDDRYKLVTLGPVEGLYDLRDRHDDGPNLLFQGPLDPEASEALDTLRAEVARIVEAVSYEGG